MISALGARRRCSSAAIVRAVITVLCGCVLALATGTGPASAHAILLETSPAQNSVVDEAPASAELRFNEPVELIDGAIRLFPSDGKPQTLQGQTRDHSVIVDFPPDLSDGTYLLSYRIVSADGHPVGGAITFHVGQESVSSPAPAAPDIEATPTSTESGVTVLTVIQYLGLLAFAGLLFFHTMILRSISRPDRGTKLMARGTLGLGVAASLLLIPVSALRIIGQPLDSILDPSSWAPGVLAEPVALAAVTLLAGCAALLLFNRGGSTATRYAAVVAGALTAASPVLVGHSQTMEPVWLMAVADIGHLLAGSFWLGGILGLLRVIRSASPRRAANWNGVDAAITVVARFSRFALYSVILLAVSGTLMAVLVFSDPSKVIGTGYGRTLLIKLVIVAAAVGIAAWNRRGILPAIAAEPAVSTRWTQLRRTVSYEAALLAAVIAVTGFLGNSSPDHEHHHETGQTENVAAKTPIHIESQGLVVDGTVEPSAAGANTFTFDLTFKGEAIKDEDVEVSARLPEQQLGPLSATTTFDPETGEYETPLTLPVSGDWEVQVSVRVSRFEQPIALVPVRIK